MSETERLKTEAGLTEKISAWSTKPQPNMGQMGQLMRKLNMLMDVINAVKSQYLFAAGRTQITKSFDAGMTS